MKHWTTRYPMKSFMAFLQLSIILHYDTLKIKKSGLDRGPIIMFRENFKSEVNVNHKVRHRKVMPQINKK